MSMQISHNRSIDGVLDLLNSKNMTEGGPVDLIDDDADDLDDVLPPPPEGECFCCLHGAIKAHRLDSIISASPALEALT